MANIEKKTLERLQELTEHTIQLGTTLLGAEAEEVVALGLAGRQLLLAAEAALHGHTKEAAHHATEMAVTAVSPVTKGLTSGFAVGYDAVGLAAHVTGVAEIPTANSVVDTSANYVGEKIGDSASERALERTNTARTWASEGFMSANPIVSSAGQPGSPLEGLSPDAREGAYTLDMRSFLPFSQVGGGFDGDGNNRGFSPDREASSRLHSSVVLRPQRGDYLAAEVHADKTAGPWGGFGPRAEGQAQPTIDITSHPIPDGTRYEVHIAGSNPLVPGSPEIDVHSSISITRPLPGHTRIETEVKGDAFPALEMTLTHENGQQLFVCAYMPPETQLGNLLGDAQRPMGTFKGTLTSDFHKIYSADFKSPTTHIGNSHDRGTFTPESWYRALTTAATPDHMPLPQKSYDHTPAGDKNKFIGPDMQNLQNGPQKAAEKGKQMQPVVEKGRGGIER